MKFSQFYLTEDIAATKRTGIHHIYEPTGKYSMSPSDFIDIMKYLEQSHGGKISSTNSKINEKVDGFGFRFGLDATGKMFIETSHSGPKFDSGVFSQYSKDKTGDVSPIAKNFDIVLDRLKSDSKLNTILKKYNTESGIKVICECFLVPIGKEEGDLISFVVTKYRKDMIGSFATFVMFDVIDGEGNQLENYEQIIDDIKKISNNEIKFDDNTASVKDLDLSPIIKKINDTIKEIEEREGNKIDDIVNDPSRKKDAMDKKRAIKAEILNLQKMVSDELQSIIPSSKFGDSGTIPEGIVLNLANGILLKIVSNKFKEAKAEYNKSYKK